ncbi:IMP dehydrogenase [Halobacteriovorax sp. GB3]|uniref:IMP dehydrogenase n=1 Tax=Halobacteriovorax sp. GB3 TaxID=2719615 RepID=UPI002361ED0D|nr:IMP dehydrogenase [Halobacteriovorax sp. GB3]MDD0853681.1 IMP dehydrogenase [Halobacteriovorax sp. GB3]
MPKILEDHALTYDDVLLRPGYSEILPASANLKSRFTKNIHVNIPIVSAAMDTVTEAPVAIVMAQEGGIGVIHKNLSPEHQADEVRKVKKYEAGMVTDPITVAPEDSLHEVVKITKEHNITGVPVVGKDGKLVGICTSRDMRFETDLSQKVKDIMTSADRLITAKSDIDLDEAKDVLHKHRIEKLPIINEKNELQGLITIKDILKNIDFPNSNKDSLGRLRCAAAIGVGDKEFHRAELLFKAGVDAIVIDTAHGHSKGVIDMVKRVRDLVGDKVDIVAGNIATAKACEDLIKAGADAVKVGIGPGSICTTRIVAGIGVPQLSAVMECAEVCKKHDIPFIADGGIKYSGDIVKAIAGGASCVMIGSLFAGCDETPGEMVIYQGRSYKIYRGMGSLGAMALGSKDRYGQASVEDKKLVPEGIEGQVPYKGSLASNVYQMVGGLRAGMGYVGAPTIDLLQERAEFIKITSASLKESHPHDVVVTKEAPNYQLN